MEDQLTVRSDSADVNLTIRTGDAEDNVVIRELGVNNTFNIFLGTSVHDDVIQVNGAKIPTSSVINVNAFAGNDTMLFNDGGLPTSPAVPVTPDDNFGVIGFGVVNYQSIENIPGFFPPTATINGPFFTTEGNGVALDASASPANNATIVSTRWDLNGDGIFNDSFAIDPVLTWQDLVNLGMNDDGEYEISLEVSDSAGNVEFDTGLLTIFNAVPTINFTGPSGVLVGEEYVVDFSAVDPGDDTVSLWEIDWGDGSPFETFASDATSASHVYQSTGDFTPVIRATDEDVASPAGRYTAIAPTVTVTAPIPRVSTVSDETPLLINEGDGVTLIAEATGNPSGFTWDLNNDGVFGDEATFGVAAGNTLTLSDTELASLGINDGDFDGTQFPIAARVSYGAGASGSAVGSADLTVLNVAPEADLTNTTQAPGAPVNEGDSVTISFANQSDASSADESAGFLYSYDFNNDGIFEITDSTESTVAAPLGLINDAGTRTVRGVIKDKDGGETEVFTGVRVLEVAPSLNIGGADSSQEGEVYTLNLSADDPGNDTITRWTIHWGDGTSESVNTPTAAVDHIFADDGELTITVTAQDEDGLYQAQKNVTVSNVAPTVQISGPAEIDEGDGYTLSLAATDPGDDSIITWTIDWGDGTSDTVPGSADEVFHIYADDSGAGTFQINVTAEDEDGSYQADTTVTVNNVAPVSSISATGTSPEILAALNGSGAVNSVAVNEGSNFILYIDPPVDPGTDTVTEYTVDWGDGSPLETVAAPLAGANGLIPTLSLTHVYTDGEAVYDIIVSLTDEDGTFINSQSIAADARNVAPVVEISGASAVDEGEIYTLALTPFDPGDDTITAYQIDWGDGGPIETFGANDVISHIYRNVSGSEDYTIAVDIIDEDETDPDFNADATKIVRVNEVAPVLSVSGAATAIEGTPYTLSLGELVDPGSDLGIIPVLQYIVDWGDGNIDTYNAAGDVAHAFEDGLFNNLISVDVVTAGATYLDAAQLSVEVANAAPVINSSSITIVEAPLPDINTDGIVNIYDVSIVASSLGGDVRSDPLIASADLNGDGVVDNTDLDIVIAAYDQQVPLTDPTPDDDSIGTFAEGDIALLEGTFSDLGLADSHEALIDWGDGTTSLATVTPAMNGEGKFAGRHVYAKAGVYKVTITVADDEDADMVETLAFVSGVAIHDGVLHIVGTTGDDTINVNPTVGDATSIDVSANFIAGGMQSFSLLGLTGAVVFAGNGNDVVTVDDAVALPFMIAGGRGEDELNAGGGSTVLIGGEGDDTLNGGDGGNLLLGGAGMDSLNGGALSDFLVGGSNDDEQDGGGDDDVSYFSGSEADYTVTPTATGNEVNSPDLSLDGNDTLVNVEDIVFEDSTSGIPNMPANPWADELIARLVGPEQDTDGEDAAWLLFD